MVNREYQWRKKRGIQERRARAHAMERYRRAHPMPAARMPSGHACEEKRQTRAQCIYDATH